MRRQITRQFIFERESAFDITAKREMEETVNMLASRLEHLDIVQRRALAAVLNSCFTLPQFQLFQQIIRKAIHERRAAHHGHGSEISRGIIQSTDQVELRFEQMCVEILQAMVNAPSLELDGLHAPTPTELKREAA